MGLFKVVSFRGVFLTASLVAGATLQHVSPSSHPFECVEHHTADGKTYFAIPAINDDPLPPTVNALDVGIQHTLPLLHSKPGASQKIYLNFLGCAPRSWGVYTAYTPPYDIDGDPTTISGTEANYINEIWQRVSEDYAPFNIDITTELPANFNSTVAMEVCIGGSWNLWYGSSAGGVAYIDSWLYGSTSVWVFEDNLGNGNPKYTAEAVSHEAGHGVGLYHQGQYDGSCGFITAYHPGTGSGETGWAPIMGVGYYQNRSTWYDGSYNGCSSNQEDLSIITSVSNGITYVADDHGATIGTASAMNVSTTTVSQSGVISSPGDVDLFSFTSGAGTITLSANTMEPGPNLDIVLRLLDNTGSPIAATNPGGSLDASLSTSVSQGVYYLEVSSTGVYGALGQYDVSGTIVVPSGGDSTSPTAAIQSAPSVSSGGGTSYSISIQYSDDFAVNVSSLGTGDISVSGPNSFSVTPTFSSVNVGTNGTPRVATYTFTPPGGSWNSVDNGTYTISTVASQVFDTSSNALSAGSLGTFSVSVSADGDGDGVADGSDCAPSDITRWRNQAYPDADGDGFRSSTSLSTVTCFGASAPNGYTTNSGAIDNCSSVANVDQADLDNDGQGNACDADIDGDGIANDNDCDSTNVSVWRNDAYLDSDGDGVPNNTTRATSVCFGNTIPAGYTFNSSPADNCPSISNSNQLDTDGDGRGDACEPSVSGPRAVTSDYNGDGYDDLVLMRARMVKGKDSKTQLQIDGRDIYGTQINSPTLNISQQASHFVRGDFDGDGKTDYVIVTERSATAAQIKAAKKRNQSPPPQPLLWTLVGSTGFVFRTYYGQTDDKLVPGKYFQTDKSNIAVFRNGVFYIRQVSGEPYTEGFGQVGDLPAVADYDGDGLDDLAIYRPSTGYFWYKKSSSGAYVSVRFGSSTDIPVPMDMNGDGRADFTLWSESEARFYIKENVTGSSYSLPLGSGNSRPISMMDVDHDGKSDLVVFEAGSFRIQTSGGVFSTITVGTNRDKPLALY